MAEAVSVESYSQIKDRLKEIVEAVSDESLPLEEALDLYEEAVKLGSQVSSFIRSDIDAKLLAEAEQAAAQADAADAEATGDAEAAVSETESPEVQE